MKFFVIAPLLASLALALDRSGFLEELRKRGEQLNPPEGGTDVNVALWIQDIEDISPGKREITLNLYLAHSWKDLRLRNNNTEDASFTFDGRIEPYVWDPQLIFANTRDFRIHESPMKNAYYHLNTRGFVWKSIRARVTVPCNFSREDDVQCKVSLHSFVFPLPHVRLSWSKANAVYILDTASEKWYEKTGFRYVDSVTSLHDVTYSTGSWGELDAVLKFERIADKR